MERSIRVLRPEVVTQKDYFRYGFIPRDIFDLAEIRINS